jgi:hypothetical protein
MVHIDLAIKRDPVRINCNQRLEIVLTNATQNLGVETLKVFKSERARFSPFAVALLLAIGKGQSNTKFEQQIFEILRTSIVFSFKGDSATKEIAWFKGNSLPVHHSIELVNFCRQISTKTAPCNTNPRRLLSHRLYSQLLRTRKTAGTRPLKYVLTPS